jgi:hypothetical protein
VPVLAELIFHGLQVSFGDRGLQFAQLLAALLALSMIARQARRLGATDVGGAAAVVLIVVGGLLAFAGIRAQLFGLVLFPALVGLLRSEESAPSRRVWFVVPLLALWSNLHGSGLLGAGLVLLYLLVERARSRPAESAALAVASLLALCATPSLWETPTYYLAAVSNEAARRGYGLWAPLSLRSGFDVLLLVAGLVLLAAFLRAQPRLWQVMAAAVLAALTVHASRNGVWLLMFLAAPAATALRTSVRSPAVLSHSLAVVLTFAAIAGVVRGPLEIGASPQLIEKAIDRAHGRPILAEPAVAEQIAQAGGRVWISNPLDAFRRSDQLLYLEWLQGQGSGARLLRRVNVAVVSDGSPSEHRLGRDPRFSQAAKSGRFRLFVSPVR